MNTNSGKLEKDMISQPELWRLALLLSTDRIDVALYPPVAREEMIWRSYGFDPAAATPLRAVEDIIYDNPLLLCDFKKVDCIISNVPSLPIPATLTDTRAETIYREATATTAPDDAEIERYATGDDLTQIAQIQIPEIKAFLQRTFYNATFDNRIAALCRYLLTRPDAPRGAAVYAIVRHGHLTLIATDSGRLLTANCFKYEKEIDAAYYILTVMQQLGLSLADTPVMITSSAFDVAGDAYKILSHCLPQLGPIPFPMLRYRATKSTLLAPLSLIIRPLCE